MPLPREIFVPTSWNGGAFASPALAPDGTAAAPAYSFSADPDTGFYRPGDNRAGVATAAVARWEWDASGHFKAATDNTYDIGQSGANRPRDIYAAQFIVAASTMQGLNVNATNNLSGTRALVGGGSLANPSLQFNGFGGAGFYTLANNRVSFTPDGATETLRMDNDATADSMRMMLYDFTGAALKRVTRGAADSGGVGFRLLRIPN